MGVSLFLQSLCDLLNDRIYIIKHRVVPEAEHLEAKVRKVIISMGNLGCLLSVLAALHLYDEASLQANEVNDKRAYGPLATKTEAVYLSHTEARPELALCIRKVTPCSAGLPGRHTHILAFPRLRGNVRACPGLDPGMGVSLFLQGLRYHLQDCTSLIEYRIIPEAQYLETKAREVIISAGIILFLLSMLAAVNLYD